MLMRPFTFTGRGPSKTTQKRGNELIDETLFKPDSQGKTRVWSIRVEGDTFIVSHGIKDGKIQEKETKNYPKNVGRSNEVSAEAQAVKAAKAKWTHQKDRKGYGLSTEEAVVNKLPMLALDYHKHGHRIVYPAGVEPKLDGIRAFLTRETEDLVRVTSRTGKDIDTLPHIARWAFENMEPETTLDGEIYLHGKELEDISSAVKKTNELTPELEFWVFDIGMTGLDNGGRRAILSVGLVPSGPIKLVETKLVNSEEEMKTYHKAYVNAGFEGCIIRNRDGMYKFNHRSPDLQKYKDMLDSEFIIVDTIPDKDGNVKFVLAYDGGTFPCVKVGNKEENTKNYLGNKDIIGKRMTVQYQKLFRGTGCPEFPIGKTIRDYE
jgi:DNA ligase-1